MFTGIVTHVGLFRGYRRGKAELALEASGLEGRAGPGDSLAVDGVCLTAVRRENRLFLFNLSRETLERSTLGALRPGDELNLELPLTLASSLGGHLVSGHVDFRAKLLRSVARRPGRRLEFSLPREFRPFLVAKGSVAVNGVSLTVAGLRPASFEVELIPVTLDKSNLRLLKTGSEANVECDMIGKYVYNFTTARNKGD
jgi:riboflavin synthase